MKHERGNLTVLRENYIGDPAGYNYAEFNQRLLRNRGGHIWFW